MDFSATLAGCVILTILSGCHSQTTLKATIDMAGIKGDVTFTSQGVNQPTSFTFALTGVTGSISWELRDNWVDLTVMDGCADDVIGPRVMSNIGGTLSTGSETGQLPVSSIPDVKMLLGRSILLTMGNNKACGTLMKESTQYTTAFVRLQGKISGEIWFRQAAGERAEILADVFDPSSVTTVSYNWKIYTGTGTNCSASTTLFNPSGAASAACGVDNQAACPVGDMTGKHGQLSAGQRMGTSVKFMHDTNLPMVGTDKVIEKHLVILDASNKIVSCGMITQVNEKQVNAVFNKDGVRGTVKFTQKSPFDVTVVLVNLFGLKSAAAGYHVHLYPVPVEVEATDSLCSEASVGGHWNPFNKPFPQTSGVTTDQFEVGDISGKFGSLAGVDQYSKTSMDYNLPLFGPYSVVGRSLVIHKSLPNAPRWVCANLNDVGARTVAIATLKSPVIGTLIFSQSADDPMSDTSIYGDLNYADGTMTPTTNHMWMVHDNMMANGSSGDACASVGGMYNPFNVKGDGDYSSECKQSNPFRCQVGDGTRQAGSLSIRTDANIGKKFFVTVRNMPLSGHGAIVGKTMVIHAKNSGAAKLACGKIYHLRAKEAIVDSWTTGVSGYFKFSQKYSHISDPTMVFINVTDMNSIAGTYHVHVFPIPKDAANPCSGNNVAGHYNPFRFDASTSPAPKVGTFDKYEVGDLSGKNGLFENMNSYDDSYADNMLNLFGVRSVVGRSVVIHKMSDGARWSCGNIREDVVMTGGKMHRARAEFRGSGVTGHAMLTQYIYPDGAMSDTSMLVYINYTDSRTRTMGHKITVGSRPAFGDMKSSSNRCASTSTMFNPFQVNTQTGYDECSMSNPLRCAVGDISGKQGTYDVGGGKMFITDVNLPLYGRQSVIGLSLVIGAASGGSAKLACANIIPENVTMSAVSHDSTGSNVLMDMRSKYAMALQTHPWNVAVVGNDDKPSCGSYKFTVYFMGPNASDLKMNFERLAGKGDNSLGNFKPSTCAADKTTISVLFVTLVFLLKKVLL